MVADWVVVPLGTSGGLDGDCDGRVCERVCMTFGDGPFVVDCGGDSRVVGKPSIGDALKGESAVGEVWFGREGLRRDIWQGDSSSESLLRSKE